jgi:hypothetical protein
MDSPAAETIVAVVSRSLLIFCAMFPSLRLTISSEVAAAGVTPETAALPKISKVSDRPNNSSTIF